MMTRIDLNMKSALLWISHGLLFQE